MNGRLAPPVLFLRLKMARRAVMSAIRRAAVVSRISWQVRVPTAPSVARRNPRTKLSAKGWPGESRNPVGPTGKKATKLRRDDPPGLRYIEAMRDLPGTRLKCLAGESTRDECALHPLPRAAHA